MNKNIGDTIASYAIGALIAGTVILLGSCLATESVHYGVAAIGTVALARVLVYIVTLE